MNEIVTSGRLDKGHLVRLMKYTAQQVKDKKYGVQPKVSRAY